MKKLFRFLFIVVLSVSLAACGNNETSNKIKEPTVSGNTQNSTSANGSQTFNAIDVNLTKLSSTMVYSEVYNMLVNSEDYLGKTVKMSGQFAVYQDQNTQKYYYACIIADATACCSQGIEFVLDGEYTYPKDYPDIYSVITVTGIFDTYEENGYMYCQLIKAKME